ncbi:DUF563 domain-containing protein [Haloarchaeobius sp. FL176]|uniref:glycosyltransferase family 61 protein n=1 Tax=Haloarchaeobius sp. FL176 TaxID=2967129 RepID=UPI0021476918|nr:glycosyltransferase family 61 protein [Haloarchaeobius sp. FL176]
MVSAEFAPSKLRRKIRSDGVKDSLIAAGDLLVRKRLGRPLFDPLVYYGLVQTVSRDELKRTADQCVSLQPQSQDSFAAAAGGGTILSETGLAITASGEIIEESAAAPPHELQAMMGMLSRQFFFGQFPLRALVQRTAPKASTSLGTAAPFIPRYPNYYHWMVETVPKLRYVQRYEKSTGDSVTLVISPDAPPFVDETLRALDWPAEKVERASEPAYAVQKLIIPSFPQRRPADFEWIRRQVLGNSATSLAADGDGKNVYISRAGAVERRVLNEGAVMEMLSEYGFKRYRLEERSLAENAHLFSEADIVVAPHGAGITDIIFSTDCTVIELFGDKIKQPYEILASVLDLEYRAVYCKPESADIRVDVEELESVVADVNIDSGKSEHT